jgi:hypothetical protein
MTFIHLGDDHVVEPAHRRPRDAKASPLRRSIAVPYRVSQWCPLGFPPPSRHKRRLLLANIDPSRHATRGVLARALQQRARELNLEDQVRFSHGSGGRAISGGGNGSAAVVATAAAAGRPRHWDHGMLGPMEAAEHALSSTFCLCPTGDSKGFTA